MFMTNLYNIGYQKINESLKTYYIFWFFKK